MLFPASPRRIGSPHLPAYAGAVLAALLLVGCGGSPTSPSPAPQPAPAPAPAPTPSPSPAPSPPPEPPTVAIVAGSWSGQMRFLFLGDRVGVDTKAELQQADRAVTGTWLITSPGNDARGEIRGVLEGTGLETVFRGTVTWISDTATGTGRCVGTATFSGAANASGLRWTSPPGWDFGTTCSSPPQEVTWTLTR